MRDGKGRYVRGANTGAANRRWAGDDITYSGVHQWLRVNYGPAQKCDECGSEEWVQWANISRKYLRQRDDWKELCSVCHRRYDGITKLTRDQAQEMKRRWMSGEKQTALAKEYGLSPSAVSRIVRGEIQYYG